MPARGLGACTHASYIRTFFVQPKHKRGQQTNVDLLAEAETDTFCHLCFFPASTRDLEHLLLIAVLVCL